jgi:hypothetical protein
MLENMISQELKKERDSWPWYRKLSDFFFPELIKLDWESITKKYLLATEPKLVRAFDFNNRQWIMVPNPLIERLNKEGV